MTLEVSVRSIALIFAVSLIIPSMGFAADINDITGTWSGNWTPKGGVLDAMTIEARVENGKIVGRFRTPVPMDFTRASYDPKTGVVSIEATDSKAGKTYKLDARLAGSDIKGTIVVGGVTGDVLLIKWTYVPR
jgi:hypothetical protein